MSDLDYHVRKRLLENKDAEIARLTRENEALRARERRIIDETWSEAKQNCSLPSTKLQDKIIAAVDEQPAPRVDYSTEVTAEQIKAIDDRLRPEFETGKWETVESEQQQPDDEPDIDDYADRAEWKARL